MLDFSSNIYDEHICAEIHGPLEMAWPEMRAGMQRQRGAESNQYFRILPVYNPPPRLRHTPVRISGQALSSGLGISGQMCS